MGWGPVRAWLVKRSRQAVKGDAPLAVAEGEFSRGSPHVEARDCRRTCRNSSNSTAPLWSLSMVSSMRCSRGGWEEEVTAGHGPGNTNMGLVAH